MIYVASSWKNPFFEGVVDRLRAEGFAVYDFKRDEGAQFHWSEAGVSSSGSTLREYLAGLAHARARQGFRSDFTALEMCTTCVLVLPCGRSAHLELGWACGRGKHTAVLFDDSANVTPELMYAMVECLTGAVGNLVRWLWTCERREPLTLQREAQP